MANVTFKDLRKAYGTNVVVKQVDLEIADGEFVVLLGPSGCGKSTVLRMLAGLESITDGQILIADKVVNDLAPGERDIAMVFQNYALYPHMTVQQNMAFCLENMRLPKKEIAKRVTQASDMLGLDELLARLPSELSGGQRQRVAIGRAIVRKPKVFLMDEPLSNLDAKLRGRMRAEIAQLHDQLKITTVYVTHDQIEAMTMADRIVILNDGVIQQVGSPMGVYRRPVNLFVAGFIGSPSMNFIDVELVDDGDRRLLKSEGVEIELEDRLKHRFDSLAQRRVVLGVRPQSLYAAADDKQALILGTVETVEPYGPETYIRLALGGQQISSRLEATDNPVKGEVFALAATADSFYFFDPHTGSAIY